MASAVAFSARWRVERVEPLRRLRRDWKAAPDALSQAARQCVAKAEQAVERLQMDHLAGLSDGQPDPSGAMNANVAAYARHAALTFDPVDICIVESLSIAFFDKEA
jgi:hypothetical protein